MVVGGGFRKEDQGVKVIDKVSNVRENQKTKPLTRGAVFPEA